MDRPVRWYDYITLNIYFLGLTFFSQANGLITPLLVAQFVGESQKATYFGTLRLWTLMTAVLMQSLWGFISDRSTFPWGRRRPFIALGSVAMIVFILLIGFLFAFEGLIGYILLFTLAIFLSASANAPQAAAQALIPDLVPENKRGAFSGVKAVLEIPLPVILISFTVGRLLSHRNTWGALGVVVALLAIVTIITMWAPEKQLAQRPGPLDWRPFLNLVSMTAVFTILILGLGWLVAFVGRVLGSLLPLNSLLLVMGALGLLAMATAVLGGVWSGVRIGLGEQAVHNPSFTWWVINRLAFLIGLINLSTFAVFYFQSRLGFSQMQAAGPASRLIYVVGVMIFLTALAGGWLTDRFGTRRILTASGLLATGGAVLILLTTNLTVISAGGAVIGLAAGMFYAANWALGTELVPRDQAARYLGISNLAGAGAGAIGAYIGGPIADLFTRLAPTNPGLGYVLLFAIYGLLFLLSVMALSQIKIPAVH